MSIIKRWWEREEVIILDGMFIVIFMKREFIYGKKRQFKGDNVKEIGNVFWFQMWVFGIVCNNYSFIIYRNRKVGIKLSES